MRKSVRCRRGRELDSVGDGGDCDILPTVVRESVVGECCSQVRQVVGEMLGKVKEEEPVAGGGL